jgi:2-iminobutanoate/2-iminopropanoate deaminase
LGRRTINSARYRVPTARFTHAIAVPARGTFIFVSGLTARTVDGTIVALDDYVGQTRQILENLQFILAEAGAGLNDVIQLHTYLRDIRQWPAVQGVWETYWANAFPASTAVEVARLFDERQLIEIEAVARVDREFD